MCRCNHFMLQMKLNNHIRISHVHVTFLHVHQNTQKQCIAIPGNEKESMRNSDVLRFRSRCNEKERKKILQLTSDSEAAAPSLGTSLFYFFPTPQCHHVSFVDFVVLPPGHGRSVTDF